jgi:elongation of very long chain fatty acids protein 6
MSNVRSSAQLPSIDKLPFGRLNKMTFSFEEKFDVMKSFEWHLENWHIPLIFAAIYLGIIYFGQKLMANREPIKARKALILWNIGLASFSIIGFTRVFPEFLYAINKGFHYSVCNNSYIKYNSVSFWIWLFVLSKTPELVDTLFLVLRKQKLKFLHTWHHFSVLIFAWFVYASQLAANRWYCTMNYGVHAIMYTYYALKAFPNLIYIPKWVSMIITSLQTLQMLLGCCVIIASFHAHLSGQECATDTTMLILSAVIYVSYLVLFSHFFYKSYIEPKSTKAQDERKRV